MSAFNKAWIVLKQEQEQEQGRIVMSGHNVSCTCGKPDVSLVSNPNDPDGVGMFRCNNCGATQVGDPPYTGERNPYYGGMGPY